MSAKRKRRQKPKLPPLEPPRDARFGDDFLVPNVVDEIARETGIRMTTFWLGELGKRGEFPQALKVFGNRSGYVLGDLRLYRQLRAQGKAWTPKAKPEPKTGVRTPKTTIRG